MPTIRKLTAPSTPAAHDEQAKADTVASMATQPPLPPGWAWTTIGEVASINERSSSTRILADDTVVTFIPMAAVDAASGRMDTEQQRILGDVKKGFTPFVEGDVLFAKITPCVVCGAARNGDTLLLHRCGSVLSWCTAWPSG